MSLVEKAKTDNAQRDNVLEITGLRKHFPIIRGFFSAYRRLRECS